jgi:hypothetical protein
VARKYEYEAVCEVQSMWGLGFCWIRTLIWLSFFKNATVSFGLLRVYNRLRTWFVIPQHGIPLAGTERLFFLVRMEHSAPWIWYTVTALELPLFGLCHFMQDSFILSLAFIW